MKPDIQLCAFTADRGKDMPEVDGTWYETPKAARAEVLP